MAAYYYTRAAMPHDQKQKASVTIANAYLSGCNGQTYRLHNAVKVGRLSIRLTLPYLPAAILQCFRHCPPRKCLSVRRVAEPTGCYTSININPTRHSLTATFLFAAKPLIFFLRQSRYFFFSHTAAKPPGQPLPSAINTTASLVFNLVSHK